MNLNFYYLSRLTSVKALSPPFKFIQTEELEIPNKSTERLKTKLI